MTLDQLKYFETAANTLHIGKAAQLLNISQPSLSISIKKLESELEVPLFQSEGRGIALTSYGKERSRQKTSEKRGRQAEYGNPFRLYCLYRISLYPPPFS